MAVFILLSISRNFVFAQSESGTVSGVVTDDNGPIVGVTVYVKGTTNGVSTGPDGTFTISGLKLKDVLVFTMIGYTSEEIRYRGQKKIDVTMSEEAITMDALVVTALGIKREEMALSYNVQQLDSKKLTKIKDANFVNSLTGKVAGVQINSGAGGPGSSSRVVMRGMKSIEKSNAALYVIDGIPMYNRSQGGGAGSYGTGMGTESAADINPEDIESINMLTGPSAAALYGSDAANGVIIINTKKGKKGPARVRISNNTTFSSVYMLPEMQSRYGGEGFLNWGNKVKSNWDPMEFFNTGISSISTASVSTGTEKNQTYVSISSTNTTGTIPGSSYDRYNLTARNTSKFAKDHLTLDISANIIKQDDKNLVSQGKYNNPLPALYLFPRGEDFNEVKNFERYDEALGYNVQYWPYGSGVHSIQNPYWIQKRMLRESGKMRYNFSGLLKYDITDWLNITARGKMDNSVYKSTDKKYASTLTTFCKENGGYSYSTQNDMSLYGDIMANINKTWGKWSLMVNAGASINDTRSEWHGASGNLILPNLFAIVNLDLEEGFSPSQGGWHDQTQSVFASAEVGWNKALFLTVTGRNDWASQLAFTSRSSFFYPSVGLSAVISNLVKMPSWFSYLKVMGSYSQVASAFSRYLSNPSFVYDGQSHTWKNPTTYPAYDLKPEDTRSWETGISIRLFDRVKLDATYYHSNTYNQLIYAPLSSSSGYSNFIAQTGNIMNQGVELALGYSDDWEGFSYETNLTYTYNDNKIIELAHGIPDPITGTPVDVTEIKKGYLGPGNISPQVILREGGSMSDIYLSHRLVEEDGVLKMKETDLYKVGQLAPKGQIGWSNTFSYAGVSLGIVITARLGGLVYSATQGILDFYGASETSAVARDNGGVKFGNNMYDPQTYYQTISTAEGGYGEQYIYDATNVRIQELSLSYRLPSKWFKYKAGVSLGIVARNLLMLYCKAPFDPELSASTTDNYYQGVDYFMQPSTRNIGFNIQVTF